MVDPQPMPTRARTLKNKPFPGAIHQWDATLRKSYNGAGDWVDLVGGLNLPPASGNAPTLNESVGSPGASFSLSGKYWVTAGVPTGFLAEIHKGTASFTLAIVGRFQKESTSRSIIDTRGTTGTHAGMLMTQAAGEAAARLALRDSSVWLTDLSVRIPFGANDAGVFVPWNLFIYSYDQPNDTLYEYKNGVLVETFANYFSATTATNLSGTSKLSVGAGPTGTLPVSGQLASIMISDQYYADVTGIMDYYTNLHRNAQPGTSLQAQKRYYGSPDATHPPIGAGQSLVAQLRSTHNAAGQKAFDGAMALYDPAAFLQNCGITGSALLRSSDTTVNWLNDSAAPSYTKGTLFSILESNYPNLEYILWKLGNDDIAAGASKANFKAGLNAFITLLGSSFDGFEKIVICPWHRSTTPSIAAELAVAEAEWEVAAENAKAVRGPESYDLDLADETHWSEAANVIFGQRCAQRMAAVMGHRSETGTLGPRISAAVQNGADIDLTLTLDDNTDITVATNAKKSFYVTDNGVAVTINGVTKNSATSITLTLASTPSGTVKVYVCDNGLSSTNAEIVRGNGALLLPLQSGVVTAS